MPKTLYLEPSEYFAIYPFYPRGKQKLNIRGRELEGHPDNATTDPTMLFFAKRMITPASAMLCLSKPHRATIILTQVHFS